MRVSEIVTWAGFVDAASSPADIDVAGLGQSRRRDGALEEIAPADPRFSVIYLVWSTEPPKLQSISVNLSTPESIPDDELEAQFGPPGLSSYPLDLLAHPPQRSTFFQGKSGKELCLTVGRGPDGRLESVRIHAVRPLPKPAPARP